MEKINIAEILKDCPTGMELDCTMYDNVTLIQVREDNTYPIKIETPDGSTVLTRYGGVSYNELSKCIIFPKGKTTWEGFVPPCKFKDGDIAVSQEGDIHLLRTADSSYCAYRESWQGLPKFDSTITTRVKVVRLATEEEKQKLFDAIKDNGYKWNPDTKTLERLVEPSEGTLVQIDFTRELRIADEVEVILGDYEFVLKDGKTYFVKKNKYPKTYEECCKILGIEDRENGYCGYEYELLGEFQKLYICRDAYWKIAGEQMGLDKPWKPDWGENDGGYRYCIRNQSNKIVLSNEWLGENYILSFPTEEMRDEFYENFKELIDKCKELL